MRGKKILVIGGTGFLGFHLIKRCISLKMIITRMQGWQLETFRESYDHKKNKGISLFKKKLLENK